MVARYTLAKYGNPIEKWAKDLNKHFFKEDTQMTNKHMKRFSTSAINKMQIKITMRYHLISVRMGTIKKKKENNEE